jgi:hypothetical protein
LEKQYLFIILTYKHQNMKSLFNLFILCILLHGCAGVKLYKDESFSKDKQTGLKFYYPKPYLLVERNSAKDVPLKTTIIYLPDITDPVYAKVIRGMGSNAFSLALANGSIASYGVTTDSKIPETIAAAGGVLTGWGSVLTGVAANTTADKDVQQSASVKELKEVQALIDPVKVDLDKSLNFPSFITEAQKADWTSAKTEIQNTKALIDQLNPTLAKKIIESMNKVTEHLTGLQCKQDTPECKNFNARPAGLIDQITKAKEILEPKVNKNEPSFELYEILNEKGVMTYKLVKPVITK